LKIEKNLSDEYYPKGVSVHYEKLHFQVDSHYMLSCSDDWHYPHDNICYFSCL